MIGLALLGCTGRSDAVDTTVLTRLSLDLRGIRPSAEELEAWSDDPDAIVDDWMVGDRFEERLVDRFARVLLSRAENYPARDIVVPEGTLAWPFERAIGDEAARLMARVAADDLPWTEVVTADWTMIDGTLAARYPTDHVGAGWSRAHYTDGRPAAGVLSTNGLYQRYRSTPSNKMRKPANQVSRIFVCADFLRLTVPFDAEVDLGDEDEVADAIRNDPGCATCHDVLDPIAAYLWGHSFDIGDTYAMLDAATYHPERERLWRRETGLPPAWYGQSGESLEDLGHQIAQDPRFVPCAVQQAVEQLLPEELEDVDALEAHAADFADDGLRYRALVRSIVTAPAYGTDRRWMDPDLLESQLEALTGYVWTDASGQPLLHAERHGLLTLAGGLDGETVTAPADQPSATVLLVQDRLATAAADHAVTHPERLFHLDPTQPATRSEVRRELARLRGVIHGVLDPHDPDVDELLGVYDQALATADDHAAAWTVVLAVMFRDPAFVTY